MEGQDVATRIGRCKDGLLARTGLECRKGKCTKRVDKMSQPHMSELRKGYRFTSQPILVYSRKLKARRRRAQAKASK